MNNLKLHPSEDVLDCMNHAKLFFAKMETIEYNFLALYFYNAFTDQYTCYQVVTKLLLNAC